MTSSVKIQKTRITNKKSQLHEHVIRQQAVQIIKKQIKLKFTLE